LWALADAQVEEGELLEAQRSLRLAAQLSKDPMQRLGTALRLGAALTLTGNVDEAGVQLKSAEFGVSSLSAEDLVRLRQAEGQLAVRNGDLTAAEKFFNEAAISAHRMAAGPAEAAARINALRARLDQKNLAQLESSLDYLFQFVASLPPGEQTAQLLLSIGDLCERSVQEFRSPLDQRSHAFDAFSLAQQQATSMATRAYATGYLGSLYEDEGRSEEGLRLTFQAISMAQSINAQDQLYRWEWQAGRLERKLGQNRAAANSFDRALFTLSEIRNDVLQSSRHAFSQRVEPVYL